MYQCNVGNVTYVVELAATVGDVRALVILVLTMNIDTSADTFMMTTKFVVDAKSRGLHLRLQYELTSSLLLSPCF